MLCWCEIFLLYVLFLKIWEDDQWHVPGRDSEACADGFHHQRSAVQKQTVGAAEDQGHLWDQVPVTDWKVKYPNKTAEPVKAAADITQTGSRRRDTEVN